MKLSLNLPEIIIYNKMLNQPHNVSVITITYHVFGYSRCYSVTEPLLD